MQVTELFPDDSADIGALAELRLAVAAADAPWVVADSPFRIEMTMRHGWDGEPGRYFLARTGGELVGALQVDASTWDNTDLAWLQVEIAPSYRRQGLGTELLDHATSLTTEMGRPLQSTLGWDSPGTRAFATATGFELRTQDVNRRMDVREIDPALLTSLYDEALAASTDYELVRYEGRTPDDLADAVAVMTSAINDAPLDDLEYEDEVYTAKRVHAYEDSAAASGHRLLRAVARHRTTGELAGHTVVAVDVERPELAHQHDTSVVGAHRGHQLGLLLKAGMALWLRETAPEVTMLDTWNAETNGHMIAVNERLGYRVLGRELAFQRRLPGSGPAGG